MDCAMHVQHKDREVFDRENRVIPANVVAVSSDTGGFRFGDGVTQWRDLPRFGADDGTPAENPKSHYSGPLHLRYYEADEELPTGDVPMASECILIEGRGFYFGNGSSVISNLKGVSIQTPTMD